MEGGSGGAIGSADSQAGGIVDQFPDLDQVEEDGGIDWSRARGVVITLGQALEDFVRQLKPWS